MEDTLIEMKFIFYLKVIFNQKSLKLITTPNVNIGNRM